jgi:calcineurin-like phosphoesterase family protein
VGSNPALPAKGDRYMHEIDQDNTFFVADYHFDHANIIKYCKRPFKSVDEMNEIMLQRYNETVKDDSTVFFLGDLAFGKGARSNLWWLKQLKGNIIFIKGNHDNGLSPKNVPNFYTEYTFIEHGSVSFELTHYPIPRIYGPIFGWNIHGHHHNNMPEIYPLVNPTNKTINVGVELIDYRPISFTKIKELINGKNVDIPKEPNT